MGAMAEKDISVRKYQPADRDRIRELCCLTGFLGTPIDPVFEDREVFADYLTSYYTDAEPECAFVVVKDGTVEGYLIGARFPHKQHAWERRLLPSLAWKVARRYGSYNTATRNYIRWILLRSWREVPESPKGMPHFHFNVLEGARSLLGTRDLVNQFFSHLAACGETSVFGQVVTFGNRRGARMFERYGFEVVNRAEITKYRALHHEPVYLCTIVRDLRGYTSLEGRTAS